ncbi:uncharacterized protein [Procambarus clarkii]|uniref:uncharacterized protein isoform X2 n=2 Tax=Procambarus clarkii TaxID=6728 RepID=UPI00374376D0
MTNISWIILWTTLVVSQVIVVAQLVTMAVFALLILGCIAQILGQAYQPYGTHAPLPVVTPTTSTVTTETTLTHTLRETTTSDVWVTEQTAITLTVTQTSTQWEFVPQQPQTVTSVIRVTSTPVVLVTATVGVYPVSTMISVYSQFVTTTDTVKYWQTITHVAVAHEIQTVPVVTTQELFQEIVTTITQIVTTTVTSTTARYYA